LARTRKSVLRPTVIFLIGIILVALAFTLWAYAVPPVVRLNTFSITPSSASKNIANASSLILYFGYIYVSPANQYNKSRPVDDSFTLAIKVTANPGPVNVTVYVRSNPVFSAKTNATDRTISCNSTLTASNKTIPSGTIVYPDIVHPISVSLLDAFTGGATPYMVIQNLNTTKTTSVSYFYNYTAKFRNSLLTLAMFIVGGIIAVIEGIGLLRFAITRVRER
jgi:hypothetical protein